MSARYCPWPTQFAPLLADRPRGGRPRSAVWDALRNLHVGESTTVPASSYSTCKSVARTIGIRVQFRKQGLCKSVTRIA